MQEKILNKTVGRAIFKEETLCKVPNSLDFSRIKLELQTLQLVYNYKKNINSSLPAMVRRKEGRSGLTGEFFN